MLTTLVEFWGVSGIVEHWIMERDFAIKLAFGVHRLAKTIGDKTLAQQLVRSANTVLASMILIMEGGNGEQKRSLALKIIEEVGKLEQLLWTCRAKNGIAEEAFGILFREYGKVKMFCSGILADPARKEKPGAQAQGAPRHGQERGMLSSRQSKIVEVLQTKEKVQVWELQKIMPEVTKRTLRRDLDDLLSRKLIERQGEWNAVFYRLKR